MLLDGVLGRILTTNRARGWAAMVGALLIDISVGEFNLLSFLYPYMSSYFHHFDNNITPRNMSLIAIYWVTGSTVMSVVGVYIYNKIGFRLTFLAHLMLFLSAQLIGSTITNFHLFAFVYGMLGGGGQGGLLVLPLYCVWRYFPPSHRGLISGTILSAYALAPFGTSMIALMIVNPENKAPVKDGEFSYFQEDVFRNVPRFLRIFGAMFFLLGLVGISIILEPLPEETDDLPLQNLSQIENPEQARQAGEVARVRTEYQISPLTWERWSKLMQDQAMIHFFIIIFVGFLFPHYMMMNFKQTGLERLTRADKFINIVGSIGLIINAFARFIGGLLFKKFGIKLVAGLITFTMVTSALLFLPMSGTKLTFTIQLWYFDVGYGFLNSMIPLINHEVFRSDGPITYSSVMMAFAASNFVVALSQRYLTAILGQNVLLLGLALCSLAPVPSWLKILARIDSERLKVDTWTEKLLELEEKSPR